MKTIAGIQATFDLPPDKPELRLAKPDDPKAVAKEFEVIFLNEFLKTIMEQTSLGKDKLFSAYLPVVTLDVSKSLAERGIGVGDFLSKSMTLRAGPGATQKPDVTSEKAVAAPARPEGINKQLNFPVEGRISSGFGLRQDPLEGGLRRHNGIDIAVPEGTPVKPAAPGRVVFSGFTNGYGNCVIVEHEGGITSFYAHGSANLVKAGDVVDKNSIIALSGSTGRSKGPHVHFEVRKDGVAIDPSTGWENG